MRLWQAKDFRPWSQDCKKYLTTRCCRLQVLLHFGPAFFAIFLNKPQEFPGVHFQSVHSLVGLGALLLFTYNLLDAAYRQGANPIKPKLTWISVIHRNAGLFAYFLGFFAVILGLYNRVAVVDWRKWPLEFTLPAGWKDMGGWGTKTHGQDATVVYIAISGLVLIMMLSSSRPIIEESRKKQ
mmetsp:Transcript_52974/g.140842  ORF Transcript_52974/g.140842 Transcript_52974/m.140842 type:complete len:182 (-) Transcript_52974:84-629(-)